VSLRVEGVVNRELFRPTAEGEARILLLINAFSRQQEGLQGRTKLAKLDFLLRYPEFFERALIHKGVDATEASEVTSDRNPVEQRMVRFRYGPWDPSYFALLGSLIGRGLIEVIPYSRGLGYRATGTGMALARELSEDPAFEQLARRSELLKRHFNQTGATLKKMVYELFPEVADASWREAL
jgi:hypothetical protein